MSVMLMRAVAVLDKPKLRFPSMSVAWTMMVYWDTFWNHSDVMNTCVKQESLRMLCYSHANAATGSPLQLCCCCSC